MTGGQGLGQWVAQGSSNRRLWRGEGSLERCRCSETCPGVRKECLTNPSRAEKNELAPPVTPIGRERRQCLPERLLHTCLPECPGRPRTSPATRAVS